MEEPEIHVENREALAYLVAEAAEIEHGLLCCYLYAAFSLGRAGRARPFSGDEGAAVGRWRQAILAVARDEMTHLALVSNLMNAIGAAPHLRRPNFPVAPGYHPAGVVVSLAPFSRATIDHFVYLERPEGIVEADGAGFAPVRSYVRGSPRGRLVPTAQDYQTVGHLYRGISAGLASLAGRLGERNLFCGDPRLQVDTEIIGLPSINPIVDLESAGRALETIVTQGEGSPTAPADSHYRRFLEIRDELAALQAEDPAFEPGAGVARNPVMRRPPEPEGLLWVDREPAATVLDVANAMYAAALRAFGVLTSPAGLGARARPLAADTMARAMLAITSVAELLTTLPASTTVGDVRAGLTFTMSRSLEPMPEAQGAFRTLHEACEAVAGGLRAHVVALDPTASEVAAVFDDLSARLRAESEAAASIAVASIEVAAPPVAAPPVAAPPVAAPPVAAPPVAAAAMPASIEEARGRKIVLRFEAGRCIHARHCVTGAPGVFRANVVGPWLHPDEAPIDDLVAIARACPSGAITYERLDGGEPEALPPRNVVRVRENGPYAVHADLRLAGRGAMFRATLCRCGASGNKPFCDGSHVAAGFAATGEPATRPSEPLQDGRPLEVRPQTDGPLVIAGPIEICSGTGRTIDRLDSARLCRCGGSQNKPFCDGSHARNGFRAPA